MITFAVAYLGLLVITGTQAVTQVPVSASEVERLLGKSVDAFRQAAKNNDNNEGKLSTFGRSVSRGRPGSLPRASTLMKGGPSPGGFCDEPEPEMFFYLKEWKFECALAPFNLQTVHSFQNLFFVLCDAKGGFELFFCPEGSKVRPKKDLDLLREYTLEDLCECKVREKKRKMRKNKRPKNLNRLRQALVTG